MLNMIFKNKKILIAGGTGFVGKAVIQFFLNKGAKIFCITRHKYLSKNNNLEFIQLDLRQISKNLKSLQLKLKDIDCIIYMAASIPLLKAGAETITKAKEINLDPFINFLEMFGQFGAKIIFTSTIDVYGLPKRKEFKENQKIDPISTYAVSKYCCEKYLELWSKMNNNKNYTILRFSQVYGPEEPLIRVIPFILNAYLHNKSFIIFGSGKEKRKFLYVKDAVIAICKALEYGENDIYNISGDEAVSIKDIIPIVERIVKKKILIEKKVTHRKLGHILPNTNKAKNKLRYTPLYTFENGVKETIDNYNNLFYYDFFEKKQ